MSTPPILTDRAALLQHRHRARLQGAEMFLHEEAVAEVEERLAGVNRKFTAPAILTAFPDPWRNLLPGAHILPDDPTLDLEPEAHDLIIHGLGLHWSNDPVGQLIQCRRALRPDGLFLGITFGGQTLHELRATLAQAEAGLVGGLSPRVLPMGEIRDLGGLLQRAGFSLPVADVLTRRVTYRTMFHLIADLRAMGETSALADRPRRAAPRALFPEAARLYAEHFPADEGRILATFSMVVLTGWAPHESQQKPLRPGSAITRLADALGRNEGDGRAD